MKKILTLAALSFLLVPAVVGAQLSTTTDEGVSISSELVEQVQNLDGEEVEHAPVSLHLGVRKRFDTSPADAAELDITPQIVLNNQLLELYVRNVALTAPVTELSVGEAAVSATVKGPARLFGFIPVQAPYAVTANFDTRLTDVSVGSTAWWDFLAATESGEDITSEVTAHLEGVHYLSRIQLRALLLEAIVEAVTS